MMEEGEGIADMCFYKKSISWSQSWVAWSWKEPSWSLSERWSESDL